MAGPAAGYKFGNFAEIKSHSSVLYNERMAILFYLLDMKSINLNTHYRVQDLLEVRGTLRQIYKNIRTLIRNNPTVRATLNLDTKDPGIYTTDIVFGVVDKMVEYCESSAYTTKKIYVIVHELNNLEMLLKDVLQYFHYFIRPDFRQKPDIEIATERYKEIADRATVEELRTLIGTGKHGIDFGNLGSSRIELSEEIEYDEDIDGPIIDIENNDTEYDENVDGPQLDSEVI